MNRARLYPREISFLIGLALVKQQNNKLNEISTGKRNFYFRFHCHLSADVIYPRIRLHVYLRDKWQITSERIATTTVPSKCTYTMYT